AVPNAADGARFVSFDGGYVKSELQSGTAPRHPSNLVSEDLLGELLAVSGGGDRDADAAVQVVHLRGIHQSVHGGADAGGSPALAVQAVVEGGDHLALAVDGGVDVHQWAHPVQSQYGQGLLGQGAQVAGGSVHSARVGARGDA